MATLKDLVPILDKKGFLRQYLGFGDANLRVWDWKTHATKIPTEERLLWKFLLCGSKVDGEKLRAELPSEMVDRLIELGLCVAYGDKLSLGKNALINYQRHPVFVDMDAPSKARIGDDVHALISQIFIGEDLDILSLHSSGGTEALVYAGSSANRLTILPTPGSEGYLRANFEINGIQCPVSIVESPDALEGEQFDVILSRTPSVAVPDGYNFHEIEAAGDAGLDGYRTSFGVASQSLRPSGKMLFVSLFYGGDSAEDVRAKLQGLANDANLILEAEITSRQRLEPGTNVFNQTIYLAEKRSKKSVRELIDDFMGHYEGRGYSYAYFVKGVARKRADQEPKRHRIQILSDRYYGTWAI